ncbi:hypothetical protein Sjap_004485 [Stephania japonica]|uniref:Uncharacterized protein n=1 Tax=Stephania japonica TaxID=461633 RepID=A0AAP0K2D5_9MAGN
MSKKQQFLVETTLEKRRRVMQLSKVGLMVPHDDQPLKKRGELSLSSTNATKIYTNPDIKEIASFIKGEPLTKEVQLIRKENEIFDIKAETMTVEEVKRQRSKAKDPNPIPLKHVRKLAAELCGRIHLKLILMENEARSVITLVRSSGSSLLAQKSSLKSL